MTSCLLLTAIAIVLSLHHFAVIQAVTPGHLIPDLLSKKQFDKMASAGASSKTKRVSIIGADGRTGRILVNLAARQGYLVDAYTRTGNLTVPVDEDIASQVTCKLGDVTKVETLENIEGDAVFFCASASKLGGTAVQVDKEGLANVARLCVQRSIPRLVALTSAAVTRPWSPVHFALNWLAKGIMKHKFDGENLVRDIYKSAPAELGYTIIRPGALTLAPLIGAAGLELNQRDLKAGSISREDVAALCLESIKHPAANRTTLECYNKGKGFPISTSLVGILFKGKTDTAYERQGNTWEELFSGLASDVDLSTPVVV